MGNMKKMKGKSEKIGMRILSFSFIVGLALLVVFSGVVSAESDPPLCFTQLTTDLSHEANPDWSPDGAKIAYRKDSNGGYPLNIRVMNSDGSNQHALTHSTGHDGNRQPKWSPDGTEITFWAFRPWGEGGSIWKMNADGSAQTKIYVKSNYDSYKPTFSPDGTKIAFDLNIRYGGGPHELHKMNPDGTNVVKILKALGNKEDGMGKDYGSISYSPDGTWIAFESERSGNWDIWIVKPDGSDLMQLTIDSSNDFYPAWFHDGEQIAFTSDRSGNNDIWILTNVQEVINGETPNCVQLTKDVSDDKQPSWSPDGTKIVFSSDRSGNFDIWVGDVGCVGPELPDLTLSPSDISFSNPNPAVGETVTITTTVHNVGNADAAGVTVQFFDGDPDNGGTKIEDDQTIASISAGGTGTAHVDWTATAGSHDIYVIVDPYDDILESDESNNEAHINCVVEVLSDSIKIVDIAPDAETELAVGEEVTFDLTVDYSLASSDWGSIDLSVIDNNGRHFLDSNAISAGSGTAHFTHSEVIQGGFPEDDEKFIVAVNLTNLDVVECVAEDSISYGLLFPDLKVEDISFSDNPKVGDPITITATIRNIGRANVGEFDVVFKNEDAVTPLTVIGRETLDGLMAGGSETVEIEWRWMVICGRNEISVVADDLPPFLERNKDRNNNRLSKEINIECHRADDGRYTPGSKKALILAPYHWQGFIEYSDDLVDDLEEMDWQVDYKINDEVTIENFENWLNEGYGLIHITTHGKENGFAIESFHAENTEENKQARNERWGALIRRYGEESAKHMFRNDSDDINDKPNIMVNGDFIRTRCNGLEKHPLVYFEACSMGLNDDMREAFISMGAGAYLGFDRDVALCTDIICLYKHAEDVSNDFYGYLINQGYTVDDAVANSCRANGEGCGPFTTPCVELLNYGNENLILVDPITVTATCPIDLVTTDPEGLIVSRESCEIGGATYTEADINGDGDPDDQIIILERKIGNYTITVIPEPDAEPTDTYTLEVSTEGTTTVLAENVTISEIPEEPYIFESTTRMCGDVNGDRTVNVIDVVLIYKRALDPGYPLDLPWAGDVNCDRNINVIDVVLVYKRALDPGYVLNCCCEEGG